MKEYLDEKLHEECGVFGMYDRDADHDVVATAYYGAVCPAAPRARELRHCRKRRRRLSISAASWAL